MKVLLLAAGFGSRLRPLTDLLPKCLVPINGRPLLYYWVSRLAQYDCVTEIIINTHYLPGPVREYIETSPWRDRVRLVHEDILLGTGGTLFRERDNLADGDFLVAHADNLTLFNLGKFVECHESRPVSCVATMMTFKSDDPQSCGVVETDENGVVNLMHEKVAKPPTTLANAAVYLFNADVWKILDKFPPGALTDISTEIIPQIYGKIFSYHNNTYHRDIGSLLSWELAQVDFPSIYSAFVETGDLL